MLVLQGEWNCPDKCSQYRRNSFALFTKTRNSGFPNLTPENISIFKETCNKYGYKPEQILPHDSYLINLGNPEAEPLMKSREAFLDELHRCNQLGLDRLNFHPGSYLTGNIETCLKTISESINWALDRSEGVIAVIENTAGQGTNVGYKFEHIRDIIDKVDELYGIELERKSVAFSISLLQELDYDINKSPRGGYA